MNDIITDLQSNPSGKLLVIYPHPDDETVMSGGLVLAALANDWQVKVVSLTQGEAGKIHTNGNGKSVKEIRGGEFKTAMKIFGVSDFELWDFADAGLGRSRLWKKRVEALMESHQPDVVVTYDHSGVTGHPDHIALSISIFQILKQNMIAKNPDTPRLWWVSSQPGRVADLIVDSRVSCFLQKPTHYLKLTVKQTMIKWRAIRAYKSQRIGAKLPLPLWLLMLMFRVEYYHQAKLSDDYKYRYIAFEF